MSEIQKKYPASERLLKFLTIALLVLGGVLRLIVYLQNRNLIIDESNVARNIFERGYARLLQPLDYEQYAPPVFLWIVKTCAILFGFSESALKIYPFVASIAALVMLFLVLRILVGGRVAWCMAALFAVSPLLIRYSSELKQYMPDVLITLSLIYLALKIELKERPIGRFMALWFSIGTVAIWSSMPSVFILAGVGCYYGLQCLQQKDYKRLGAVAGVSLLWVAQFLCYYMVILKPQISSDYLQNFHHNDFLYGTPQGRDEWQHNWAVSNRLIRQFADKNWFVNSVVLLMLVSIVAQLRRGLDRLALVLVPFAALLVAATLNQFSLLPRVSLFSLPLILLITGLGLNWFAYSRFMIIRAATIVIMIAFAYAGIDQALHIGRPYKYEQTTEGFEYLQSQHIDGSRLYVHHATVPAFIYYTTMHPDSTRWSSFKNANKLPWMDHYEWLASDIRYNTTNELPVAFIYTNISDEELSMRTGSVLKKLAQIRKWEKRQVRCYFYDPKP
jgi:4-amino-4-deoxy-L-arabinose transferase-like glycosyltransferase